MSDFRVCDVSISSSPHESQFQEEPLPPAMRKYVVLFDDPPAQQASLALSAHNEPSGFELRPPLKRRRMNGPEEEG